MWNLQENVYNKKDLLTFSNYLKKSKKLTQGDKVKEFENKFSSWNKTKFCHSTNWSSFIDTTLDKITSGVGTYIASGY